MVSWDRMVSYLDDNGNHSKHIIPCLFHYFPFPTTAHVLTEYLRLVDCLSTQLWWVIPWKWHNLSPSHLLWCISSIGSPNFIFKQLYIYIEMHPLIQCKKNWTNFDLFMRNNSFFIWHHLFCNVPHGLDESLLWKYQIKLFKKSINFDSNINIYLCSFAGNVSFFQI